MNTEINKPRVLFVTFHHLNGVGGGIFASRAYIRAFAELFSYPGGFTLLYPEPKGKPIKGVDSSVRAIPVYNNSSKLIKGLDVVRGRVHWHHNALPELLKKEKFDIVVFDNSRASKDMIDVAHRHGAKVITINHNCELEFNRDNGMKVLRPFVMHWTRKYEGEAVRKSDLNLTLTEQDKKLLVDIYNNNNADGNPIEVLGVFESATPQGVSIEDVHDSKMLQKFVITGNLSSDQTVNSLLPWLETYFPILKQEIPDAQLTIAGKKPGLGLISKCAQLGVNLIPSPPDMNPILKDADCYVCPTALGGGLKLRILDGLKMGLPVITHEVSARGYDKFVEEGIVYPYSDAESFRKACKEVMAKTPKRSKVIEIYNGIFSFKAGKERLRNILNSTILKDNSI